MYLLPYVHYHYSSRAETVFIKNVSGCIMFMIVAAIELKTFVYVYDKCSDITETIFIRISKYILSLLSKIYNDCSNRTATVFKEPCNKENVLWNHYATLCTWLL